MLNENFTFFDFFKLYCNVKIEYRPKKKGIILPILFLTSSAISLITINTVLEFTNQYAFSFQVALFLLLYLFYVSLLIPYTKP